MSVSLLMTAMAVGQVPNPPTVTRESLTSLPANSANSITDVTLTSIDEPLDSHWWSFGRRDDANFDRVPDGWVRHVGIGYPKFVRGELVAKDSDLEKKVQQIDAWLIQRWQDLQDRAGTYPWLARLPPPPSVGDLTVDRYLRVELDGGQYELQSPPIDAERKFQYQLSCDILTEGLRYDSVLVEFVFLDSSDREISVTSSQPVTGTTPWTRVEVKTVRPPAGVAKMCVRLIVRRSEDGFEDIRGTIGFDNVRIDQFPQLRVTTEKERGVYQLGEPVLLNASVLGVNTSDAWVDFYLRDHRGNHIGGSRVAIETVSDETRVDWKAPMLEPGFYRVIAKIDRPKSRSQVAAPVQDLAMSSLNVESRLSSETSFVVIDPALSGPVYGPFGWTLPKSVVRMPPRELTQWLKELGVAWVKYPCWLGVDQTKQAEVVAAMMGRLQDAGIHTVGMLDVPPEDEIADYDLRGRSDLVASQLFQNQKVWQPKLESVMSRMTLKIHTWQIGGEADFSFLGRMRVRETVQQISKGLQGYGQPIDVAISWPWLEAKLPDAETSWQAICRSTQPPLQADELNAFLSLNEGSARTDGPSTWLLLDPIDKDLYDLDDRVRDLILRMATVRSHRVEAAFVRDPHHPNHGILKPDGQPDELLLPWRTTSRMIGNLRNTGSMRLRGGSQCMVFAGEDRAVMVLWSPEPTQEKIYLGENVKQVDAWGRISELPVIPDPVQPHQIIEVGPVPTFISGVDPELLAFRMAVDTRPSQFDSLLGQEQEMSVILSNPTHESMVGSMRIMPPEAWTISESLRQWEMLGAGSTVEKFNVVLGNTATIGNYEVPIQFELDTVPPKLITVYRDVSVGPKGLTVKVTTRLLPSDELRVRIDITNQSAQTQAYNANLFAPGRQFQNAFIIIKPGQMTRREIYWERGKQLVGKQMRLRAREQDGDRVMNYTIDVNR